MADIPVTTNINIANWATKWRIKIKIKYPDISVYVPFILKITNPPPVYFHGTKIPSSFDIKYLANTLDTRLNWGPHIQQKRKVLKSRLNLLRLIF